VSQDSTRTAIVAAARSLFAERGYKAVTIRQIAKEAGLSPAMVMKVVGSKAELFAVATPLEPERLSVDTPVNSLAESSYGMCSRVATWAPRSPGPRRFT